jgi:hypothetical protein
MSKKLIAVAAAAALAITGLVGVVPASASVALTILASGVTASAPDAGDGTSAAPYTEKVPVANIITDGVSFSVTTASVPAGTTVSVQTTGAVRVVDALTAVNAAALYNVASGLTTWSKTTTAAGTVTFHVFTTSDVAGTFRVSTKSSTSSATGDLVYVKGIAGGAYNLKVVAPATMAAGVASEVLLSATDVFGNEVQGAAAQVTYLTTGFYDGALVAAGTLATDPIGLVAAYSATKKASAMNVTPAGTLPFVLSVKLANNPADVAGLPKAVKSFFTVINGAGSSDLAAKVAELQKIVDRKVTKKRFNTLAKKWNAAFPSQAVKLKK